MTAAGPVAAAAPGAARTGGRLTAPAVIYALYVAALALALWPTLPAMAGLWLGSSMHHHGALAAPVALWMIARTGAPAAPRPSLAAAPAIAAGLALWLFGRAMGANIVEQAAFVFLLIAGVGAVFGLSALRRWAFPLGFLVFMIPFGAGLAPLLQDIAAKGVTALLNLSGVSAARDGYLVTTSAGPFAIAEACSGLNFLLAALMAATVFAWAAFDNARKAALFIAFSALFALGANIARAWAVILIATRADDPAAVANDHVLFGWVFYGALLALLIAIGARFADRPVGAPRAAAETPDEARRIAPAPIILAAALVFIAGGYARLVVERAAHIEAPAALPLMSAPGWRIGAPAEGWAPDLTHADRRLYASYESAPGRVLLAAGYFTHDRPGAEIAGHASRTAAGPRWRKIAGTRAPIAAFGARRDLQIARYETGGGARLDVATLYWLGEEIFDSPRALKLRQARARLVGRNPRGGVLHLASAPPDSADAIATFFDSVEPLEDWLARIDSRPTP